MTLMDVAAEAAKAKYPTGVLDDGFEPLTPTETSVRLVLQEGFTMGHVAAVRKVLGASSEIFYAMQNAEELHRAYSLERTRKRPLPRHGEEKMRAWAERYPYKALDAFVDEELARVLEESGVA